MLHRLLGLAESLTYPRVLAPAGVRFGERPVLHGLPLITCARGATIDIGDRVVLCSRPTQTALGVRQPTIFRALRPGARIEVGADCGFSGTTIVAAESISIGDGCLFGAHVTVFDTDFHSVESLSRRYEEPDWKAISRPVRIGKNVFLGTNAIVAKGVEIGDNTVVGAGSVVVSSLPANVIAGGNPCKVIRSL